MRWLFATARIVGILLLALLLGSWQQSAREPVTLSYFRLGWSQPDEQPTTESIAQQFIRATGIHLKDLPVPENTLDQLDASRKLLERGTGPDVIGVDLIWSGVLGNELIDLRPYLATEIPSLEPELLPSYTIDGKLVAIPYKVQAGVLEYRADLLREYGYRHPPKTWDELERMAARIQAGQRAKGKIDFWGYVWQGAAAEALTCNALEWQASEGGGRIIESNRRITVNNPATIRAWKRAKRWIGWISPPGVVGYHEIDSINVFDSGGAAFNRVWGGTGITRRGLSRQIHWRSTLAEARTGYTSMPSGPEGSAATLGGSGLAVSRHSLHPKEAIELVRFLIRAQIKADEEEEKAAPYQPHIHDRPLASELFNHSDNLNSHRSGIVSRPSSLTGEKYEQVARAYIDAVHAVLTGQKGAPEAAAELEKELAKITGFTIAAPQKAN